MIVQFYDKKMRAPIAFLYSVQFKIEPLAWPKLVVSAQAHHMIVANRCSSTDSDNLRLMLTNCRAPSHRLGQTPIEASVYVTASGSILNCTEYSWKYFLSKRYNKHIFCGGPWYEYWFYLQKSKIIQNLI